MDCFRHPLTIPRLEAHPLELEVDGVGLVPARGLRMAGEQKERQGGVTQIKRMSESVLPAGENFEALDNKLTKICWTRVPSVLTRSFDMSLLNSTFKP